MRLCKRFISKCVLVLAIFTFGRLSAKNNTEIERFIRQVGETNKFVEVSNLWRTDNNFDKTELLTKVERAHPLTIDYTNVAAFMEKKTMAVSLVIPGVNGGSYTIDLARYDFFSGDFQVHVLGENGADGLFDYKPGLYYRGVVNGIPGSVAAFSFFNNEVYGVFSIPGEGNYNLVPNTMVGNYYDYNQHYILYNDNELKIKEFAPQCATDALPKSEESSSIVSATQIGNEVYNSCTYVRVFEVGDYAMYLTKGKSVSKVANFLTALFNNQSTIYRNEGIPIVLKYLQVDSVKDAYQNITKSNSSLFLDTFGKVTKNVLHGCDLAILASTALNGGYGALGGVAWLRAMCSSYNSKSFFGPYGFVNLDNSSTAVKFPTYSWDVEVLAHEMGHIVGSPHTHACCWNPPGTGKTAIDGCYTLEGSCAMPVPQYPAAGGTIMSYCHLTSTGINFANGFGDQPGDTIRYFINKQFSATCGAIYTPTLTAFSDTNRTLSANRECTDMTTGTTYYWYDNNTADMADDTLVLMIRKNGNDIGNLNTTGFSVKTATNVDYGSGKGISTAFIKGTPGIGGYTVAMRRYWSMQTPKEPTSAVDVMFPFKNTDTADVNGSVKTKPALTSYMFYKTDGTTNPDAYVDSLKFAAKGTVSFYTNAGTASTTNWSLSTLSDYNVATMKMTSLSGGGTGIYTFGPVSVENMKNITNGVYVYPNPAHDNWFISVPKNDAKTADFRLYTVDGHLIRSQPLKSDYVNSVNAALLPPGTYTYRIITADNVYAGSLIKE